eukprot:Selendium_serpulae@DN2130_c0_g1_i1.p2
MQFEEAMGDGDTKRQVFHSFQELIHESGMADPNNPFVWSSLEAHSHKRLVQWCHGVRCGAPIVSLVCRSARRLDDRLVDFQILKSSFESSFKSSFESSF